MAQFHSAEVGVLNDAESEIITALEKFRLPRHSHNLNLLAVVGHPYLQYVPHYLTGQTVYSL